MEIEESSDPNFQVKSKNGWPKKFIFFGAPILFLLVFCFLIYYFFILNNNAPADNASILKEKSGPEDLARPDRTNPQSNSDTSNDESVPALQRFIGKMSSIDEFPGELKKSAEGIVNRKDPLVLDYHGRVLLQDSIIRSPYGIQMEIPKGWYVLSEYGYLTLATLAFCDANTQHCVIVSIDNVCDSAKAFSRTTQEYCINGTTEYYHPSSMFLSDDQSWKDSRELIDKFTYQTEKQDVITRASSGNSKEPIVSHGERLDMVKDALVYQFRSKQIVKEKQSDGSLLDVESFRLAYNIWPNEKSSSIYKKIYVNISGHNSLQNKIEEIEKMVASILLFDPTAEMDGRDFAKIKKLAAINRDLSSMGYRPGSKEHKRWPVMTGDIYPRHIADWYKDDKTFYTYRLNPDQSRSVDAVHVGVNLENSASPVLNHGRACRLVSYDVGNQSVLTCPSTLDGHGPNAFSGDDSRGCGGEEGWHCLDFQCQNKACSKIDWHVTAEEKNLGIREYFEMLTAKYKNQLEEAPGPAY